MLNVVHVHFDAMRIAHILPSVYLPIAGETRPYREQERCIRAVFCQLLLRDHSGANQAHLTDQDIEQLRQFVQAELPKKRSDSRNARVTLEFEILLEALPHRWVGMQKRIR